MEISPLAEDEVTVEERDLIENEYATPTYLIFFIMDNI